MSKKNFSARLIYASLTSRECRYTGCLSAPLPKQVPRFLRKRKAQSALVVMDSILENF